MNEGVGWLEQTTLFLSREKKENFLKVLLIQINIVSLPQENRVYEKLMPNNKFPKGEDKDLVPSEVSVWLPI